MQQGLIITINIIFTGIVVGLRRRRLLGISRIIALLGDYPEGVGNIILVSTEFVVEEAVRVICAKRLNISSYNFANEVKLLTNP